MFAVLALVVAACGDDAADAPETPDPTDVGDVECESEGASIALFGAPTGVEGDALQGFVDRYNDVCGTNITFRGSDNFEQELRIAVEGGSPPEVAVTPQPGSICEFAGGGSLVSLEDMGFDIDQMKEDHSEYWMELGLCDDGNHYGIPWFPNSKSIVFYHIPTFEANNYDIPETYEDLIALSEQIVADGMTPWCFGFGSEGATGWPGTDWIEDIFVRLHGAEVYQQWYEGDLPFNDPMVVEAFDTFGEIFFGDGFVAGGTDAVPGIDFRDSPGPLFQDPPGCLMLKQGSFIANFFEQAPDYEPGDEADIGIFAFPTVAGNTGSMGGADTIIVFDGSDENVAVVRDWVTPEWLCTLASPNGGGIALYGGHGVAGVERLPGHKDTDPNCFDSESGRVLAEAMTDALAANTFVFDASDLMPPEVGQRTFWDGMIDWVRGADTQDVVDTIEASWP